MHIGNAKLNPHIVKKAAPLPVDILAEGVTAALAWSTYDSLLWAAMAVITFLSCCCVQEVSEYNNPLFQDTTKHTLRDTVRTSASGFSVTLPYHKADPLYTGSKLFFTVKHTGDFFVILCTYLLVHKARFGVGGSLWLGANGATPTHHWFVDRTKHCCRTVYSGHSHHAGGATFYARRSVSDEEIKCLGCWKSDTWNDYVRLQPEITIAVLNRSADVERLQAPTLPAALCAHLHELVR
ncbi:hypothetical protein JCM1841_004390 [Sporobolomyces salmonicolor]